MRQNRKLRRVEITSWPAHCVRKNQLVAFCISPGKNASKPIPSVPKDRRSPPPLGVPPACAPCAALEGTQCTAGQATRATLTFIFQRGKLPANHGYIRTQIPSQIACPNDGHNVTPECRRKPLAVKVISSLSATLSSAGGFISPQTGCLLIVLAFSQGNVSISWGMEDFP